MGENTNLRECGPSGVDYKNKAAERIKADLDGLIAKIGSRGNDNHENDEEAEKIWTDLNALIQNINEFTATQQKYGVVKYELTNDSNTQEKDDGIPEKELINNSICEQLAENETDVDLYDSLDDSVREIDWSVTGPVMQGCIRDLEQLQDLNVATKDMVSRLEKLIVQKYKNRSVEF